MMFEKIKSFFGGKQRYVPMEHATVESPLMWGRGQKNCNLVMWRDAGNGVDVIGYVWRQISIYRSFATGDDNARAKAATDLEKWKTDRIATLKHYLSPEEKLPKRSTYNRTKSTKGNRNNFPKRVRKT